MTRIHVLLLLLLEGLLRVVCLQVELLAATKLLLRAGLLHDRAKLLLLLLLRRRRLLQVRELLLLLLLLLVLLLVLLHALCAARRAQAARAAARALHLPAAAAYVVVFRPLVATAGRARGAHHERRHRARAAAGHDHRIRVVGALQKGRSGPVERG